MKRLIVCLVLGMLFLSGCNKYNRIVPEEQLTEKNGLVYEKDAEKAFTGIAVRLYPNGNKCAYIHHVNGKRNGRITLFDKQGSVVLTGHYADDEMSGEWIHYKDEKITEKDIWKHGRQIQCFEFHANGRLTRERKLEENSLCMEITAYSKDGKVFGKTVLDIKNRTGKIMISGETAKEIELTLTLSDDKKHWNVNNALNKTVAKIDTGTYELVGVRK